MARTTYDELLGYNSLGDEKGDRDQAFNELLNDLADTFGTPFGRRSLLFLVKNTFQKTSPMTGNSQTYHNLGAMDLIRSFLNVIAIADNETYMWIHAQQSNELRERYMDRITDNANET